MIDLSAVGLNDTEAKCYSALLAKKEWMPALLAQEIKESRTNCYKLLDKLAEVGLAERFDKNKKLHYRATNPARLVQLLHERREAEAKARRELEIGVQDLMDEYLKVHEQAGVRYFQGKEDLKKIYEDQVADKRPIYFINALSAIDYYGYGHMHTLRMLPVKAGIPRHTITPDTKKAHANWQEVDQKALLARTWLKEDDYTAPVEWGAYGNKVYIVSFGEEASGMIIESPQIADSFRQLFKLLDRGQRAQPWYHQLPRLAQKQAKLD